MVHHSRICDYTPTSLFESLNKPVWLFCSVRRLDHPQSCQRR
ncbi:unnamed protein product [Haemonchus placei]|uniref:Uncharacterized protein n=1 Tax=Haemonchus placei TaxID=6290 RepID=A0A0N4VW98_HAEPC|nr:unnamed protein product [Haemonchus placei]